MSETYYLLAAISYGIFIVQFILSWFGGDTDLDVDLDGELDMDVSDIVSFKGLVHFVMGASGWLCIKHSVSHSIEWYDYLIALICGILFVVILYYLYKLCLKLQHQVIPEKGEALVGRIGTITIPNDISGGSSVISAFSKVTSSMIANLFGTMLMMTQDNVYVGLFGDNLININKIDRSKGILRNAKEIHDIGAKCGGGTEAGIYEFFNQVVNGSIHVDNVIIFSDMVIGEGGRTSWYGHGPVGKYATGSGNFQTLFKDFRKVNPLCNVVSVDIRQTKGTSVFDKSMNVTQVSGWSDKIFDLIGGATRGYADLIQEIEKITI